MVQFNLFLPLELDLKIPDEPPKTASSVMYWGEIRFNLRPLPRELGLLNPGQAKLKQHYYNVPHTKG